jgi:hypothetical protein
MFRILVFFMATLLLFSMMPVSLAQQSPQAEAETDASADMSKDKWFMLGVMGSTAGCLLGCVGGSLLGKTVFSNESRNSQMNCVLAGSVLLGVCAVPIGVQIYPHNVMPPPERLLGKSPEYIAAYTHAYKSRAGLLRKIFVTAGSITSNLGIMTMMMMLYARIRVG